MFWHWQNLNERKDGTTGAGLRHGRCWWHFSEGPGRTIELCWNFWSRFCGIEADWGDEDLTLMLAFPPVAFWLSFSSNWAILKRLLPRRALSPRYPDTIVVDEREVGVAIHGGRLWIRPYCRRNEWGSEDPWWVKGVSFSLNPFEWVHVRHEVRTPDGYWAAFVGSWEQGPVRIVNDRGATMGGKQPDGRQLEAFPYRYVLKNGTVQERTATVYVERRAWRPRCLRWTRLFERERVSIDVAFNDEVGERTGTWKGGTVGCSYEMRAGETALACLRRMERERVFA